MSTLLGRYIVKKIVDLGYDKDFLHPPCDENDETVTLICDSLEAVSGEELTKMASTVNLDDNCNPDYKSALDIVFWTQVSWEKLVSAAVCTYRLCMKALLRGEHQLANSFIYWFDHYVRTYRIQNWVDNQGGWKVLLDHYGEFSTLSNTVEKVRQPEFVKAVTDFKKSYQLKKRMVMK